MEDNSDLLNTNQALNMAVAPGEDAGLTDGPPMVGEPVQCLTSSGVEFSYLKSRE